MATGLAHRALCVCVWRCCHAYTREAHRIFPGSLFIEEISSLRVKFRDQAEPSGSCRHWGSLVHLEWYGMPRRSLSSNIAPEGQRNIYHCAGSNPSAHLVWVTTTLRVVDVRPFGLWYTNANKPSRLQRLTSGAANRADRNEVALHLPSPAACGIT